MEQKQTTEGTPRGNRLHIGLFGRRNSGKSSLVNALCGQQAAVVSDVPGTTTDAVGKNMEIHGLGACVLVDTAGFDDEGPLGRLRVEQTRRAAERVDVALIVVAPPAAGGGDAATVVSGLDMEREWAEAFRRRGIPVLGVLGKADLPAAADVGGVEALRAELGVEAVSVSSRSGRGMDDLRRALVRLLADAAGADDLTGSLAGEGDLVLLVMPQDIQAPKGRLILPQVQTLRNLLDKRCSVMSCTTDRLSATLACLSAPPRLIITDSQVFPAVAALCPPQSHLTSFSVLFARQKGDIRLYLEGAQALSRLQPGDRVLIAEACSHVPLTEDIGRVKLPRLIRSRVCPEVSIDVVSGNDYPEDLTGYALVIHCGACMFTRRHVLNRLARAREQRVPVTNYGIALAALSGILGQVAIPD